MMTREETKKKWYDSKNSPMQRCIDSIFDDFESRYSGDYIIEEVHESKPHPMTFGDSTYSYRLVGLFASKASADRSLAQEKYKWRGNGTGSISYRVLPREEGNDK